MTFKYSIYSSSILAHSASEDNIKNWKVTKTKSILVKKTAHAHSAWKTQSKDSTLSIKYMECLDNTIQSNGGKTSLR